MRRRFAVAVVCFLIAPDWLYGQSPISPNFTQVSPDMTVNFNLGTLAIGSSTSLIGDTSDDPEGSEVQNYLGVGTLIGNVWGYEEVYQFDITEPVLLRSTNTLNSMNVNVLDGLRRVQGPAAFGPQVFAHDGIAWLDHRFDDVLELQLPTAGTYYLSVTPFQLGSVSVGPAPPTGGYDPGGPYDITIDLLAIPEVVPPSPVIDLGVIAVLGEAITLDTFGSEIDDTEIGVYTAAGVLVGDNDDAGPAFQSELLFPSGLPAGDYYTAIGSWNTTFGANFIATSGTDGGGVVLNYNGLSAPSSVMGGSGEVAWYRFSVAVPEPTSFVMVALSTVGLLVYRWRVV